VDVQFNNGQYLYGGIEKNDSIAAKASNHDLKGLTYCMMADKEKIFQFPLFALIDYEGFRLTVMTQLPINDNSLVYGSCDAGKIMKYDSDVHKHLLEIANQLNLQPHLVNGVDMALCGDIEIHKIQDKEKQDIFFALDMARVFPPAAPLYQDAPTSIFYRMLRPEFVKKLNLPLSSDALSNWQASDSNEKEMNKHVINATRYIEQIVTEFAHYLVTNDSKKIY